MKAPYIAKKSKQKKPNPFLSDAKSNTIHGNLSEKRVASRMGARLTLGSGNKDGYKSDATLDTAGYQFRIESKATIHKSFSIKLDVLEKIRAEALQTGRTPILTVSFTDKEGNPVSTSSDYVVMPMYLFNEVFNNGD
ncbi:hypothetical protein [Vibrio phage LV6]|nr:hypothetical protein [Vibrio phage LV6]